MTPAGISVEAATSVGLFVDTNLLVLFAIGTVNRNRIETFKHANTPGATMTCWFVCLGNTVPCTPSLMFSQK